MSKAVLISIHPEWCEKIINGQKTVEIRKTRPKIETPFKCYIYCTKPKSYSSDVSLYTDELYRLPSGEIKFGSSIELSIFPNQWNKDNFLNGKVIGEFVCDKIIKAECGEYVKIPTNEIAMEAYDLLDYADDKTIYGWHISDLVIYDKPKDIRRFAIVDKEAVKMCPHRVRVGQSEAVTKHNGWIKGSYGCEKEHAWEVAYEYCDSCRCKPLNRPPQSWCYVEELI